MLRHLAIVTVSLLTCVACAGEAQHKSAELQQKSVTSQAKKPEFQLTPAQQKNLRAHVMALKLGEMRPFAVAMVGSPDREDLLGPKRGLTWKCRALVYFVVKLDKTQYNVIKDKEIQLIFNRKDSLVMILSNVDGIANRGDMSTCR